MTAEQIKADIETVQAIIAKWKTMPGMTGQFQVAIGYLAGAIEFAEHHMKLAPAPASAAPAAPASQAAPVTVPPAGVAPVPVVMASKPAASAPAAAPAPKANT